MSLTLRQTIRAKDKGKLWISARLSIADDKIVVTTDDGAREIRPRRLYWLEQNKFLLSGIDTNSRIQRLLLRFKTPTDAERAVEAIRDAFPSVQERRPAEKEDIEVLASLLISTKAILPVVFFIVLFEMIGFIPIVLSGTINLGVVVSGLFLLSICVLLWFAINRIRKPARKLLRFVEESVMLVDRYGERELVPENILWKTAESFVLEEKVFRTKLLLTFSSSSEAARVVQMIRERFPELAQTNIAH